MSATCGRRSTVRSVSTRSRRSAGSATGCGGPVSRLPIRIRLTLSFAVAMAVVLAAVGLFVYKRVGNELLSTVDAVPGRAVTRGDQQRQRRRRRGQRPDLCATVRSRGQLRKSQPRILRPLVGRAGHRRRRRRQASLARRELPRRRGEWRVLALDDDRRRSRCSRARWSPRRIPRPPPSRAPVFLPLALLAASLGGYALTARRSLRSSSCADARKPSSGGAEQAARAAGAETRSPASPQTLNEMLARLQAAVEHERRFVADASHELRTPLALLARSSTSHSVARGRARSSRARCAPRPTRRSACPGSPKISC